MKLSHDLQDNLRKLKSILNIDKSFDIIERIIDVHNTKFHMYYLDG